MFSKKKKKVLQYLSYRNLRFYCLHKTAWIKCVWSCEITLPFFSASDDELPCSLCIVKGSQRWIQNVIHSLDSQILSGCLYLTFAVILGYFAGKSQSLCICEATHSLTSRWFNSMRNSCDFYNTISFS